MNTGVELAAGELAKSLSLFQLGVTLSSSIHSKGDPIARPKWRTLSTVILSSIMRPAQEHEVSLFNNPFQDHVF